MSPTIAGAIFWIAVVCCIVSHAAILRSVVSSSASPLQQDHAAGPARRWLEIAWAILPALVLAVVLVATWRTMHPRS